jgi:hypothetical protein
MANYKGKLMNHPLDDGSIKTTSVCQDTDQAKVKAPYQAPTVQRLEMERTNGKNLPHPFETSYSTGPS